MRVRRYFNNGEIEMNEDTHDLAPAMAEKYTKAKVFMGLIARFPKALEAVARLSEYGAEKHRSGDMESNARAFLDVLNAEHVYKEALGRHLTAEATEGYYDWAGGSRFLHSVQRAWNALADAEVMLENLELPYQDKVWPPPEQEVEEPELPFTLTIQIGEVLTPDQEQRLRNRVAVFMLAEGLSFVD